LNCEYLAITKGTKREVLKQAVENAHAAELEMMCWNRTSASFFEEKFSEAPLDAYWFNELGFGGRRLGGGYHNGGYPGYGENSKSSFRDYLKRKFRPEEIR
tara:strand:- start:729 stop:1031 length:303 start_codon:yes stop_codon:yes gene_type:complete